MSKYIANILGKLKEVLPIIQSAGAADANKMIQTDAAGRLDMSLMPVGIGAEVTVCPASENLVAGEMINLWNDAGTLKARKADASTNAKPADGFVVANVVTGQNATVYGISNKNTGKAGLTIGAEYYLSAATPGGIVDTAPSAAGNIVQSIGKAESATEIVFSNRNYFELV